MKIYFGLLILFSSLTFAEDVNDPKELQEIYEQVVKRMLSKGATPLNCETNQVRTIDLGMGKVFTENDGSDTFILYINDEHIFERAYGFLLSYGFKNEDTNKWEATGSDHQNKLRVSDATIIFSSSFTEEELERMNDDDIAKYKRFETETTVNRYNGSFKKVAKQVFITTVNNTEVSRTDTWTGTCNKAGKQQF